MSNHPFDRLDNHPDSRIGGRWDGHPSQPHTRRQQRIERQADWQAGVLVGLASAALMAVVWGVLR